jgi:hypothetical protein
MVHGDQRGDWDSEDFHELVKVRLKLISALVHDPAKELPAAQDLLTDDFSSTDLRPSNELLSRTWQDKNLLVTRPVAKYEPSSLQRGIIGLSAVVDGLVRPFADRARVDIHFKVYRVQVNGDSAETEMYVDTHGSASSGELQQNMIWRCGWRQVASRDWRLASLVSISFEEVQSVGRHAKLFTDCTESVLAGNDCFETQIRKGIDHWRLRLEEQIGMDAAALVGTAIGDVNGDGLDDFYYCEAGGLPNRLFVQRLDGTVRDMAAEAGVDWLDRSRAALFFDWDNDGDQDLVVNVGMSLLLMQNDGTGRFRLGGQLRPHPTPYSLSAADYDNDGWLDLYVCSYGNNLENFSDSVAPLPYHDANNGVANTLYKNEGNGSFRDVTKDVGLDENNRRFSFSGVWEDFDNDGDQDLYVANDFGRKNLYVNDVNQSGRFRDRAAEFGVDDPGSGMSAEWGDYDNDGRMDLWVGNMFSSAGNRITFQERFLPGQNERHVDTYRRFARGNSLFQNTGPGPFRDTSIDAGVTLSRWAWSSIMADINNDGWQDLMAVNGHLTSVEPDDL